MSVAEFTNKQIKGHRDSPAASPAVPVGLLSERYLQRSKDKGKIGVRMR